ncbi:hypothetical protein GA0115240_110711 [Streptomyces sp. DvalAA-14]|nr:hypothetical protein GA0115240_110711 [Streptomyces sp. DvalAA-14]
MWQDVRTPTIDAIAKIYEYRRDRTEPAPDTEGTTQSDYKALFGRSPNSASIYRGEELGGLNVLYERVKSLPPIALKFMLPDDREEDDPDFDKVLLHEVAMIPVLLASRYIREHPNEESINEDDLHRLYLGQESYLVGDDLRMNVYVPILGVVIASESEVFDKYSIVELSKKQRALLAKVSFVSPHDAQELGAVTHALNFEDVPAYAGGCGLYFAVGPYEATLDLVNQFFEAACIDSPGAIGYAQMLFEPVGWFGDMDGDGNTESVHLLRDYATRLDALTLHKAEIGPNELSSTNFYFERLSHSHPSLRVAARRLSTARARSNDEDRIVDLCIGLEALLGGGSQSGEIIHKISLRAAAMLSQSGWGRSVEIMTAMKDLYSYRSRVVHGVPGPHKKQMLYIDGTPIHASRYALAALCAVLRISLQVNGFHPDKVDAMFVYSVLDSVASQISTNEQD